MSLVLSLLLKASGGDQSTAEVRKARQEIAQTGAAARALAPELKKVEAGTSRMGRGFTSITASLGRVRGSMGRYIASLRGMDAANQGSARHIANINAQFNDIAVMLAAGQNPIQLALQQGTQLTQVFAQMGGGASALRGIAGGLMSMVNPISLITIGSIAAGAAMTQWLTGASEDAETLEDRLQSVMDRVEGLRGLASTSGTDLITRFGNLDAGTQEFFAAQLNAERDALLNEASAIGKDMATELKDGMGGFLDTGQSDFFQLLGVTPDRLDARTGAGAASQALGEFNRQLSDLGGAGDVQEQIGFLVDLRRKIDAAAVSAGGYNDVQRRWRDQIIEAENALRQVQGTQTALGTESLATTQSIGAALMENVRQRLDEAKAARTIIEEQRRREEMERAIAQHGENSLEVAQLRSAQERELYRAQVNALTANEALRDAMIAAFDAAQGIADANMARSISEAATEAGRLAEKLERARGTRLDALTGGNDDFFDPRNEAGLSGRILRDRDVPKENRPGYTPPKSLNSGGGMSDLEREREAVEDLIGRYRTELEILRETDPVKQALIRNRETLAAATEKQRQTITDLITEREAENRTLEQQQELIGFIGQMSDASFDALIAGADGGKRALENLLATLVKVTAQALLLGEGAFAGIIGPNAVAAGPAPSVSAATGGLITGPGTGTSDSIVARVSDGEFITNAAATRRHLPLLKAINSGMPAFARGGLVGTPPNLSSVNTASGGRDLVVIENRSSTPITAQQTETRDAKGRRKTKLVLADEVGASLMQPGGGAQRALRDVYGVSGRGTRR